MNQPIRTTPFFVVLLAATTVATATGGAIPIWQVPVTIDQPGAYYLSRDISATDTGAALITIAADDVTLDLAGHRVERTDTRGDVIGTASNPANVTIRNGTVIGGANGVNLENIAGSSFSVRVENLTVRDAAADGIRVATGYEVLVPSHVLIRDNLVADSGANGIRVFILDAGRISGNVVRASGQTGIVVELSEAMFVRENNVVGSGAHGVHILDSNSVAVTYNHLARNAGFALRFEGTTDNNCYRGNRLLDNSGGDIGRNNETQYESLPCTDNPN